MKFGRTQGRLSWVAFLSTVVFMAIIAESSVAETRYVSDLLIISVKEAPMEDAPIIGYLISDTPLEVLEEREDEDFIKIKSPEGLEGWVKKKYLVSKTPKGMVIEELKEQISELEEKIVLLQQSAAGGEQADVTAEYDNKMKALEKEVKNGKQTIARLENELIQAAAQYQKLLESQEKNPDLKQELLTLQKKNQELAAELRQGSPQLQESFFAGNMKWFLSGGGMLLLGLVIGRSFRSKRTYRY